MRADKLHMPRVWIPEPTTWVKANSLKSSSSFIRIPSRTSSTTRKRCWALLNLMTRRATGNNFPKCPHICGAVAEALLQLIAWAPAGTLVGEGLVVLQQLTKMLPCKLPTSSIIRSYAPAKENVGSLQVDQAVQTQVGTVLRNRFTHRPCDMLWKASSKKSIFVDCGRSMQP